MRGVLARRAGCAATLAVFLLALAAPPAARAGGSIPEVRRRAVVEYVYNPTDGAIGLRVLDAGGQRPLPVERLSLAAIGDRFERGRRIPADLARVSASEYRGTLGLSEGEWNLDVRALTERGELVGTHLLRVTRAAASGRFPLAPPNPEVNRLGTLVGLMLGLPVLGGLALLALGVVRNARARQLED